MKERLFLLLFAATGISTALAQQPTAVLNGKTYYTYPYQEEAGAPMRQFRMGVEQEEIIVRDSLNRGIVSTEVADVKRVVKMSTEKNFKRNKKLFLQIRREQPGILIGATPVLDQDIVPVLEAVPDGNYVQFYRDIPYVDAENVLRYRNDIPAGFFTLKDNKLDGFAYWLNPLGDTIKAGHFRNGLKEGNWFTKEYVFTVYDPKNPKASPTLAKYLDGTYKDTATMTAVYKNGLLDGPFSRSNTDFIVEKGFYKNGDAVGEWHQYGPKIIREGIETIYTGEPVLMAHYFIPEKEVPGKSVIIRNTIIDLYLVDREEFNIEDTYFDPFCRFYKLNQTAEEPGLELPEEKATSYPGEDYDEGMIYGEGGPTTLGAIDFSYTRHDRTLRINNKEYTRNQLIDSIGYVFSFDKVYEEFHPNGQLKLRFRIENGKLAGEDTVFWDNGNPVNIITYLPETDAYEEQVFDYDGKLIYARLYDAKGTFQKSLNEPLARNRHRINGKLYKSNEFDHFFEYENFDTLDQVIVDPQILYESLWRFDTSAAFVNTFDPATRSIAMKGYALNSDLVLDLSAQFGEEYENVTATETYKAGKLTAQTQMNGAYVQPYYRMQDGTDTVPNKRAKSWTRSFDLNTDYTLLYEDRPFSGKFSLSTHEKNFALKTSDNSIRVNYANGAQHAKAVMKAFNAYKKNGKQNALTPYLTLTAIYNQEASQSLLYNILPFGGSIFDPVDDAFFFEETEEMYYEDRPSDPKKLSEKKAPAFDKTVEGQFLNGRPSGLWVTKDQFGNVTAKVPFVNGEIDGTVYYYKTAYPEKKKSKEELQMQILMYGETENPLLKDSLPAEKTYYLAKVCHYKNGILNGPFCEMSWLGDTLTKWHYRDGRLNGPTLERTKIAYTTANYEDGATDGIMQTYLTIPGRDTTLLYDLNFQNGMLQGESKSYHLNGNMAKHGFFLTGDPIDDFEAFDTLGFRYQYVKFKYNQPVEEKIWEENQLSVRYEFDWRDSIYFNTRDIAGSTSLERMLYELGLGEDGYREPYYGRPSLVDKTGIDYTMTKYYPNDTIARHGTIASGKKTGCWMFYSYEGRKLYEVDYYDSILQINDSVRFKSKGVLTLVDGKEQPICRSYIVEKIEKYDCSHTDHHEIRMLNTFWERDSSEHRINGYVKNYYDNGVLMNEGQMKNGLATGVWKFYDPYGSLNLVGEYVLGKRQGRWLSGDLAQVKYMGDICLNPNLPNLDEIMSYQEKLLDISVIYYQMTAVKKREYYGVNMNAGGPPENYYGDHEEMYIDGEPYYDIEYYEE